MNDKCPCIDCITLGMCKAIMNDKFSLALLRLRCSIFSEHYSYRYMNPDEVEKIFLLKLFKPLHWEERINYPKGVII